MGIEGIIVVVSATSVAVAGTSLTGDRVGEEVREEMECNEWVSHDKKECDELCDEEDLAVEASTACPVDGDS